MCSISVITFLLMEIPSQLISKRVGVEIWVPTQMIIWSVIAICQVKITGRASFLATRALLGVFEGGFIPDMVRPEFNGVLRFDVEIKSHFS